MSAEGSGYYDGVYSAIDSKYRRARVAGYEPIWLAGIEIIKKTVGTRFVTDLGCGPAHFGRMLMDATPGWVEYHGIDFSPVACDMARARLAIYRDRAGVTCADLRAGKFPSADVYTAFETLEHLDDDVALIREIPSNSNAMVIASVPTYGGRGHVRTYLDAAFIRERFGALISILGIQWFPRAEGSKAGIFLFHGRRRNLP